MCFPDLGRTLLMQSERRTLHLAGQSRTLASLRSGTLETSDFGQGQYRLFNGRSCAPLGKTAAAKPTAARAAKEKRLSSFISKKCDGAWRLVECGSRMKQHEREWELESCEEKEMEKGNTQEGAPFKKARGVCSDGSRSLPLEGDDGEDER